MRITFVYACFSPMDDTHCTSFYSSESIFALAAIPFWYRPLDLSVEQIGCWVFLLLLASPKCTRRTMPEPIRFPLIRRPYRLSHFLVIISVSLRAFLDQLEKSIACGSWCHLTRNTESDPWCPRLEICMSSWILCRTDHILHCLLMLPSLTKEPIWYSWSRPLV